MVDKFIFFGLVIFCVSTIEAKHRKKRQTWGRRVPTFKIRDGVPVDQIPPAKKDPPPPLPPPNAPPASTGSWFNSGNTGSTWELMANLFGQNTGTGNAGGFGGTGGGGNNGGGRHPLPPANIPPPPPNNWNHPPPPPPQNNWHHPPPPSNHWGHPPANNWHPPPPPPPQTNQNTNAAITALQNQMNMQMMAGVDTPDARKNLNPAAPNILQYTCPPELPFTQCIINPCPIRCKRYPMAKCFVNPCGNCAPEWIQNNMKIIDCD